MNDIKKEMNRRVRLTRGLVNVLKYDIEYIEIDMNSYNEICLSESITGTKNTLRKLYDNVSELERLLYSLKQD